MFLSAVARPRWDFHTKSMWDGKIGIWPFVESIPAKRGSKNCPAGTMETRTVIATREQLEKMFVENLICAVKERFPHHGKVVIQKDNAGPHIKDLIPELRSLMISDG